MSTKDPVILRREFIEKVLCHDYSKGPLLILAGPGTGKTFSLLETMKKQMVGGRQLADFFVTTLTNAAVGDFERKAKSELSADFENISTLHFRAKGIVHRYAGRIGLNQSFLVLVKLEKKYVLQEIKQNISVHKKITARKIGAFLKRYEEELANNKAITKCDFVLIYEELKRFYNVIDWYDVSYLACKILNENADALKEESSKQSFILVDEYQDLNKADQDIIRFISEDSQLLVVGDDDQSIYGDRFADPSGIVNFASLYPGTVKIALPVCSRCPTPIIRASNSLINHNDVKKREVKPELVALPSTDKEADGGYIVSVGLKSAKEEGEFLCAAIQSIIQDKPARASNIMVLCAYRPLGLELMQSITKNSPEIPIEDNLTKEEKDVYCIIVNYLKRFLANHNDNLALRMILVLFLEVPPRAYSVIFNIAKSSGSLWEALPKVINRKEIKQIKVHIDRFITTVSANEDKSAEEKLRIFSGEYPKLKEAVEQLIKSSAICEEVELEDEQRLIKSIPAGGVRFMTMHSSKGLDAKHIFIPFMEEEIRIPAIDIEEQRRLLYVAITRARVSVVFSWAFSRRSASRHKAGGGNFMYRSRSNFINECGISKDTAPKHVLNRLLQLATISSIAEPALRDTSQPNEL